MRVPVPVLGSTVELAHDLRCSGQPITVYYNVVWANGRVAIGNIDHIHNIGSAPSCFRIVCSHMPPRGSMAGAPLSTVLHQIVASGLNLYVWTSPSRTLRARKASRSIRTHPRSRFDLARSQRTEYHELFMSRAHYSRILSSARRADTQTAIDTRTHLGHGHIIRLATHTWGASLGPHASPIPHPLSLAPKPLSPMPTRRCRRRGRPRSW